MLDQFMQADLEEELLPKSRKGVVLGSGPIPRHFSLYDYNQLIWDCNITYEMQRSLAYYAARFNWETRKPCKASLARMGNDLKVSRKYLSPPLKDLQKYGWVKVQKGKNGLYLVTPLIGHEVPGESWRHPDVKKKQLLIDNGIEEEFPDVSF